jgi:hypothetical protein
VRAAATCEAGCISRGAENGTIPPLGAAGGLADPPDRVPVGAPAAYPFLNPAPVAGVMPSSSRMPPIAPSVLADS